MSMSGTTLFHWKNGALQPLEYCDPAETSILAADSWLVSDGTALALDLHRERFAAAVSTQLSDEDGKEVDAFWTAVLAAVPREGNIFPRVELQSYRGGRRLIARQRPAPALSTSVILTTHDGPDPRTQPLIKGPDTEALLRARTTAQQRGAEEAVLLSPDGSIAEGAYSALLWWKGETLCLPSPDIPRIDSVTARSVVALATALGVDIHYESAKPDDLDGLEVWALSALHGVRIVTAWLGGPAPAAEPGRHLEWRTRLHRLRKPLPAVSAG